MNLPGQRLGALEVSRTRDPDLAGALRPGVRVFALVEQEQLEPFSDPATELFDDAGVEEEP